LGSGPHGSDVTLGSGAAGSALSKATSDQSGKIVLLDLKALGSNGQIRTVDSSGVLATGVQVFAQLDTNAFVSDPISVDFDLDYKTDAVYFGTVSGGFDVLGSGPFTGGAWGGKLRRLVLDDNPSTATWVAGKNSVLLDLTTVFSDKLYDDMCQPRTDGSGNDIMHDYGQPIVAAPAAGKDKSGNRWVYVGTGRFFNRKDAGDCNTSSDLMTYYGIKEPRDPDTQAFTWGTVARTDLLDVTDAEVFEGGNTIKGIDTNGDGSITSADTTTFPSLKTLMANKAGWLIDLETSKERNLGQATLLGDILTFTSYMPSVSLCEFEGNSNLYAVMYDTGTAYLKSVIGTNSGNTVTEGSEVKKEVLNKVGLGKGLTVTPNIHTGRQEGSKVFVQTSTGTILELEEQNPGMVKSGKSSWREWQE
jgi:type IV pilus assembly protein PilY1